MAAGGQIIYPPLTQTYMPTFLKDNPEEDILPAGVSGGVCRIYFSKTIFNRDADINYNLMQVAVSYANNGRNAMDLNKWPIGIKLTNIIEDPVLEETNEYRFFVELNKEDLYDSMFATRQYYKVQLRFSGSMTNTNVPNSNSSQNTWNQWIADNADTFSDWSRPTLIKGIPEPFMQMYEIPISTDEFNVAIFEFMDDKLSDFGTTTGGVTAYNWDCNTLPIPGVQIGTKTMASGEQVSGYGVDYWDNLIRYDSILPIVHDEIANPYLFFEGNSRNVNEYILDSSGWIQIMFSAESIDVSGVFSPSGANYTYKIVNGENLKVYTSGSGSLYNEVETTGSIFNYVFDAAPKDMSILTITWEGPESAVLYLTDYQINHNIAEAVNDRFNDWAVGLKIGYEDMMFAGSYKNEDTSETLKSYWAELYEKVPAGTPNAEYIKEYDGSYYKVGDSGILYPDMTYQNSAARVLTDEVAKAFGTIHNSFQYHFDMIMKDCHEYVLKFYYITKGGYESKRVYHFLTALYGTAILPIIREEPVIETNNGRVAFNVKAFFPASDNHVEADMMIRRSDHTTNFTVWEPLVQDLILGPAEADLYYQKTFYDYSAESGIFYKYWVAGAEYDPIMIEYEDIFLVGEKENSETPRQLKIEYNPDISSFKYVTLNSKLETLGGKYPLIRRNSDVKYREFSFAGLISIESDTNKLFATDNDLYGNYSHLFNEREYNGSYDYIKEKKFRDNVLDFLYDGKVKLFKSTTEGNMLVKLTDISLIPETALGRMLYNFSATVTEVDDYSIDNCLKYNIQVM